MINLNQNKGFQWYSLNNVWVKGAFFDSDDNFFEKENLTIYFESINLFSDFKKAVENCNGIFTVVILKNNEIWAAVDRCVSFPLFYYKTQGVWQITDNCQQVKSDNNKFNWNDFQLSIYKSMGHTFGSETLLSGLSQLQCAQVVKLENGKEKVEEFYHSFSVKEYSSINEGNIQRRGAELFESGFKRLVKSLNGRTAVVPLSGGYDSRMIAAGLKKQGYEKVICFTYGKKENNPELVLSKRVADSLGYRWIFVEYSSDLLSGFSKSTEFKEYMHFLSHCGSMFYLQEYFAVKFLRNNSLIPDDAVFLPGHSGDLIGGSQWIKVFDKNMNIAAVPDLFLEKKVSFLKLNQKDENKLRACVVDEISSIKLNKGATVFEELDIREKITKVIFNSSQVFDFFNYEKRFPFWDKALLDFFLALPPEYREMKKLYNSILVENYFVPFGINFPKELEPQKSQLIIQNAKNKLKKYFPLRIKLAFLKKNDWKNYYEATLPLITEMHEKGYPYKFKGKSFNEVLVEYYIFSLKQQMD